MEFGDLWPRRDDGVLEPRSVSDDFRCDGMAYMARAFEDPNIYAQCAVPLPQDGALVLHLDVWKLGFPYFF